MMRQLTLCEYRTEYAVALDLRERDALRQIAPSILITPARGRDGHYDLTPASSVGAVQLETLSIIVRPKLPISALLYMLAIALGEVPWRDQVTELDIERGLPEIIARLFVARTRDAFRRGLLQGYRSQDEALYTVRGRPRFDEQLRRRPGMHLPLEVHYEEFTEDIEENRLIRATVAHLSRMPLRSGGIRADLHSIDARLRAVSLETYTPRRLPAIHYTHLNMHYRPALELARLILQATVFELDHGRTRASAFLVDMNDVFEQFVVNALRHELRLSERTFPRGSSGRKLRLDEKAGIKLEPDLSWWEHGRCLFVGDVKYKMLDAGSGPNADLYQLLAYAVAANLPGGILIYGGGAERPRVHRVVHVGKELEVVALDLAQPLEGLMAQLSTIAQRIRAFRAAALD